MDQSSLQVSRGTPEVSETDQMGKTKRFRGPQLLSAENFLQKPAEKGLE